MYFFTIALRSVEPLRTAAVFYDGRCQRATAPMVDQSEKRLYAVASGGTGTIFEGGFRLAELPPFD